ncbi:MAG: metallopeptidase TldD-related protein [Oscillospiraceae bacterium]|nr:metallopeptidase TldD-related protein [Oscillospiraceae bacterium]
MGVMVRQDVAAYALEELKKAGADKAACRVACGRKEELNVEANKFTLMRTLFTDSLSLKAICGGKKGVIAINKLDKDSIDQAVSDCIALSDSSVPDDAENIAEKIENKCFDLSLGCSDMDAMYSRTNEFLRQLRDEYPHIVLEGMTSDFNAAHSTYMNSNGVTFDENREYYSFSTMFSAKDGEKSSSFNGYGANLVSLDVPFIDIGMQKTLLDESVKSSSTRMVDGKFIGKVIVTPACEDMIWHTILDCFLSDLALVQGTSRWKDSLGKKIADSKLTMRLSPLHASVVAGERVTADGYESRDADIIRQGELTSFALSLYGSLKTGKPRANNTAFSNIEVVSGDTPLEDMIKSVERGVLLNRFSGGSPGSSGDVSGVAKNSFLIENGAIVDALSETMISFNIVDILMNIPAISVERRENGVTSLPWCCFDGITISGKAT